MGGMCLEGFKMATMTPSAVKTLTTVTVLKEGGASDSKLAIVRQGDKDKVRPYGLGAIKFTDANGRTQIVRDIYMSLLFDALNALELAE